MVMKLFGKNKEIDSIFEKINDEGKVQELVIIIQNWRKS
jgi:hypothetical protein